MADEIRNEETKGAEPEVKPADGVGKAPEATEEKQPDRQALLVEIAKWKNAANKASSEAADWKDKYRSTLSEKEKLDTDKAEAEAKKDERLAFLERKDKVHDYTENFMELGYPKEQAKKAAEAQADGDTETLFKIQQEVQEALLKKKEEEIYRAMPRVNVGTGQAPEEDAFLKGFSNLK